MALHECIRRISNATARHGHSPAAALQVPAAALLLEPPSGSSRHPHADTEAQPLSADRLTAARQFSAACSQHRRSEDNGGRPRGDANTSTPTLACLARSGRIEIDTRGGVRALFGTISDVSLHVPPWTYAAHHDDLAKRRLVLLVFDVGWPM
ncbi:unnamed protein product [Lampetra planeri]